MNSINLTRTYMKQPEGLYIRLLHRGRELLRQGKEFNVDEHTLWLDWSSLMKESIVNPNFQLRTKFQQEYLHA